MSDLPSHVKVARKGKTVY